MRSMDDVRFLPGKDDYIEDVPFLKGMIVEWVCSCGVVNHGITGELEEFIESEERDPDIEYLGCYDCGVTQPISNGTVSVKLYSVGNKSSMIEGKLYSDGTFIYFENKDIKARIN